VLFIADLPTASRIHARVLLAPGQRTPFIYTEF
jgi:hypothetical protein